MKRSSIDMFPPTVGLKVRCYDGTVDYLIVDHTKPIERIEEITKVPHCDRNTITVGGYRHFRTKTTMVGDRDLVLDEFGAHPPIHLRSNKRRYKNQPPQPGDVIGFVNFQPFVYKGVARPCPDRAPLLGAHIFGLMGETYITINTALAVIFGGVESADATNASATSNSRDYVRIRLCQDPKSFPITHHREAPFDTMLLVKLLGCDIPKRTTQITMVATSAVDARQARDPSGAGETFTWDVPENGDSDGSD